MTVDEMVRETTKQQVRLVMVTGGEPLVQNETPELVQRFVAMGHTVLVETNGSLDIDLLPDKVVRIVDMKCPDSGMSDRMLFSNLDRLRDTDEVKFVISSRQDYLWATQVAVTYSLPQRVTVLLSPAYGILKPRDLAGWILDDHLECILQLQLHKIIWSEKQRGV
jgi:7-carboxy-7-deazaguanine synthase